MEKIENVTCFNAALATFVAIHVKNDFVVDEVNDVEIRSLFGVGSTNETKPHVERIRNLVFKVACWMDANGFSKSTIIESDSGDGVGNSILLAKCIGRIVRELDCGAPITLIRQHLDDSEVCQEYGFAFIGKVIFDALVALPART
jgi:hypothetical protein